MTRVYYFGCLDRVGHHMHAAAGAGVDSRNAYHFLRSNPWGLSIDGKLCPQDSHVQGRALVHHSKGWTAMSFWDRSVDSRPGSSSTFLAEGHHTFAAMVDIATRAFPRVIARYPFPILEIP